MARVVKRSEIESEVGYLEELAKQIGIMPETDQLVYQPGNRSYATRAEIYVITGPNGQRVQQSWLPEFHYTDTASTRYRIIQTVIRALTQVERVQRKDNR